MLTVNLAEQNLHILETIHALQGEDEVAPDQLDRELAQYPTERHAFIDLQARFLEAYDPESEELIQQNLIYWPKKEGWLDLVPEVVERMLPGVIGKLFRGFQVIDRYGLDADTQPEDIENLLKQLETILGTNQLRQITASRGRGSAA